jgi:hypothetical protein
LRVTVLSVVVAPLSAVAVMVVRPSAEPDVPILPRVIFPLSAFKTTEVRASVSTIVPTVIRPPVVSVVAVILERRLDPVIFPVKRSAPSVVEPVSDKVVVTSSSKTKAARSLVAAEPVVIFKVTASEIVVVVVVLPDNFKPSVVPAVSRVVATVVSASARNSTFAPSTRLLTVKDVSPPSSILRVWSDAIPAASNVTIPAAVVRSTTSTLVRVALFEPDIETAVVISTMSVPAPPSKVAAVPELVMTPLVSLVLY